MPCVRFGRALVATLGLVALLGHAADAVNHPFGSRPMPYAAGAIGPSHVSQSTLDQAVRDFYDAWKARYLRQECDTGRYVVEAKVGPGNLTVSEAHGYGMTITALLAGHEPAAQAVFDGMYAYFREHPTATHARLMSWNQNTSCTDVQGNASASDGDLDIAFALLLADKQWGSCGAVDYLGEALLMLADIKSGDVDSTGEYVLLGDWTTPSEPQYYLATRSSDFMPAHYRSFAAASADPTWTAVLNRTYQIVDAMQTTYSPATGLLPDFVIDPLTAPQPAAPFFLEGPNDGAYGYNACRDPWRLATDFLVSGDTRAHDAVEAISDWIQSATGGDPALIRSGYQLNGTPSPDTDYLSMAFVGPLGVGAMVDASNQAWLNAVWDLAVATPLDAEAYYENTLKLLSMIVMSGNWWAPHLVSGGCTLSGNSVCTGGGYVSDLQITIGGVAADPGKQSLKLKGTLFFPQGVPVPTLTDGAQLLVEDMGAGAAAVYDLTTFTTPIPPASQTGCDPERDVWKQTTHTVRYKNRSGALPPACTAGSSRGLKQLKYTPKSGRDLVFQARANRSAIAPPVGPLRVTLVLGNTAAAGTAGACGLSAALPCTATTSRLRCE
jgi:hypothetical protein